MFNLCNGVTDYHFTKFQKDILFENMVKYRVSENSVRNKMNRIFIYATGKLNFIRGFKNNAYCTQSPKS